MLDTGVLPTAQLSYLARARIQRMELLHSGTEQHLFLSIEYYSVLNLWLLCTKASVS